MLRPRLSGVLIHRLEIDATNLRSPVLTSVTSRSRRQPNSRSRTTRLGDMCLSLRMPGARHERQIRIGWAEASPYFYSKPVVCSVDRIGPQTVWDSLIRRCLGRNDAHNGALAEHNSEARVMSCKCPSIPTRGGTVSQLRDDIDSGRTGDKVRWPDPAAAPLGTDEEGAGTPLSFGAVTQARAVETSRSSQTDPEPGWSGAVWIMLLFVPWNRDYRLGDCCNCRQVIMGKVSDVFVPLSELS
jgi:hypothetical protein